MHSTRTDWRQIVPSSRSVPSAAASEPPSMMRNWSFQSFAVPEAGSKGFVPLPSKIPSPFHWAVSELLGVIQKSNSLTPSALRPFRIALAPPATSRFQREPPQEINPGNVDAFLARAREHRNNVLSNEPGCQRFDLLTPEESGPMVFLYEVYADKDALDAHFETPYMKAYLEDTGPMIANRKRTLCALAND